MADKRHTGQEAILKVGGHELPISNVSWSRDVNTTDVQLNDSLKPAIAITGLRYTGSFDYDGKNERFRKIVWEEGSNGNPERGEPVRFATLTIREEVSHDASLGAEGDEPRTYTFDGVIITGESRDIPADDVSSTSYDWAAEDVSVT